MKSKSTTKLVVPGVNLIYNALVNEDIVKRDSPPREPANIAQESFKNFAKAKSHTRFDGTGNNPKLRESDPNVLA